jgi:hypothetical protein
MVRIPQELTESNLSPFYVVTPGYTAFSGGIYALHMLCHNLNKVGFEAYVETDQVSGVFNTPILTPEVIRAHRAANRNPIAIYPEVYLDNRLNCDRVVRYLLNRPGERGWIQDKLSIESFWQDKSRKTEFILHFTDEDQVPGLHSRSLFTPIVNEQIFFPPECEMERDGFLIYSHRVPVKEEMIPEWARPFTMIEMSSRREPTELAALYRRSKGLILFERTAAQLEALMCGCPVVAIPNDAYREPQLFGYFANTGVGWGHNIEQLEWAQRTLKTYRRLYRNYASIYPTILRARIQEALFFFGSADAPRTDFP